MSEAAPAGGCQCGRTRYRLTRAAAFVNACHCRDCQRLSGSAFAINLVMDPDAVEVTSGAPTADAMGMVRCPACFTALWAKHPKTGDVLYVRAGTLDEAERISPTAHFFVRSKHPWATLPPGVPAFRTLPDRAAPGS